MPKICVLKRKRINVVKVLHLACVAGGIVGAWNNVFTAEPLKASCEAARRMGRRTLVFLAASSLAISASAAKTLFHAPRIPPATQATLHFIITLLCLSA